MGLIDRLKSLLGLGGSAPDRERRDASVTVERDTRSGRDEVDADSEAAVKEPAAEETDTASAESMVREDPSADEPTEQGETGATEAGGSDEPDAETAETETADAETADAETASAGRAGDASEGTTVGDEPGIDAGSGDEAERASEAVGVGGGSEEPEVESGDLDGDGDDTAGGPTGTAAPTESERSPEKLVDEAESTEVDDRAAEETDASPSTGNTVDERSDGAEAAEPAGPDAGDVDTDTEGTGTGTEATVSADEEAAMEAAADEGSGTGTDAEGGSVDTIKGIGPAYAERLEEIGVRSVEDLASADAAEIAEQITVSEKRVDRWIDRAQNR